MLQLREAHRASIGTSIDTRDNLNGRMFWALKGPRFDANEFVAQALELGAQHVVTEDGMWEGHPKTTVVHDVLAAMQELACVIRQEWDCPVLALTGSNGKTTTKELLRDVLARRFAVHATEGNLNNHIGVPLTLLRAPRQPGFVIVEMGANHRGEIQCLANIALPTHGYITNIGRAHLEGFGGEEGVFLGKKELFDHLKRHQGQAFVQQGDTKTIRAASELTNTIGVNTPLWTWTSPISSEAGGEIKGPGGEAFQVHLEGDYNLPNVVAAHTIGCAFDVESSHAQEALTAYHASNHRSQWIETTQNQVVLDAYNANPTSVSHAVASFHTRDHASPVVFLGEMGELGPSSASAHAEAADQVLGLGIELWTVGEGFKASFLERPHAAWKHFPDFKALKDHLDEHPLTARQVLVKGSRSAGLERIMPYL
jgi:UDP-N-acetylmuramoyl-tripeptide--D-alanyl-D-alanine ligase